MKSAEHAEHRWSGYDRATVIDALASPGPFNVPNRTAEPLTTDMLDHARASGITAVTLTVNGAGTGSLAFDNTMSEIRYWEQQLHAHPGALRKIETVHDLADAKRTERLGLIFGFQDANMLEGDLDRLDLFHGHGVRTVQLTYNAGNDLGDGCLRPGNAGLSPFGRDAVARMNDLGIAIDLSHCGRQTTVEAIDHSKAPVTISHSGCAAVFEHPRNKPDPVLRKMAERGGVVGVYMMPFLNAEGPAQVEHFMQHLEHALDVCGEDHVGVGSDNSITPTVADETYLRALRGFVEERHRTGVGGPREFEVLFVEGLNHPRRLETVAAQLDRRGHDADRIEKVIGGNFTRVFGEIW